MIGATLKVRGQTRQHESQAGIAVPPPFFSPLTTAHKIEYINNVCQNRIYAQL